MLHSVVAGFAALVGMITPAPLPATFIEGQVLEQTKTADGLEWSYALESGANHFTATSKKEIQVTKGIAVHFATKGTNLYLIDRGGVTHRIVWVEGVAQAHAK